MMASSVGYKRKIALVIGINQYPHDSLEYCINDANDLADTLQGIDFEITLGIDCELIEFKNKIDTFIKTIERNDLVLFYFAGHGKQNEDENYLLPSDYNYDDSGHDSNYIINNGINVQFIMTKIEEKECRTTIYLFDCCRSKIKRTRDLDNKQGLSSVNAPDQTLIVYACAPGKAVLDETKNNKNGSFIENLLKHIFTPDKDIEEIMRNVASDVYQQTTGSQLPYRTSSLIDKVYLVTNNNQALVEQSPTHKLQYNNRPIVYIVDLELPSIDWDSDIAPLEKYIMNNQLAGVIRDLNSTIPFYILASMPPSDEIMSYAQLLRYYHLRTSSTERAEKGFNVDDRVTNIDSIDRFARELYEDLGQYYLVKAQKARFDHQDREETKQLLTKSIKCFEIVERDIEKTLKHYKNLAKM
ncbi:unnamed protein product [Adineta steineri]|uniref:Caspase family p20 domain-containing protein n=1 Tax=Adineta steineri TaxID=433720 RepID=A0A815IVU3_9BILA|nr:unnamed protein product [Adineta steineri]CAF3677096.1 unnamed protein product [Adineta steineri]